MVFVTGFGGYQEVWSAQVEYFAQMGYQVLTYDHRNFGRSQRTEKGHSLQQLTDDLIELLSFLKIKQAAFVGHSMGGSLLYDLIQTKPEVVALAVIVDQTPFMLNTSDWPYGFMNYTADNYAVAAAKPPAVHETLHGLAPEVALELNNAWVAHPFSRSDNFDLLKEHIVHDWRPVVKNCPVPLGVIAAKQSPYYDTEFTEWMKQVNPAVLTSVVDNCGHDVMAEVPDQFNQILRHFLLKNRYLYN
ncbi:MULTISPECIES: alpha/beta fold hydrolase [Lactobacillus]|uniref:alpha/beta fold hydrolase n=1 Tax=Lactobacillus TaxID=1578 RepID=UPI002100F5BE|nr:MULTISPECIES: alpha/beta hydrolase [Lactobacillus]